MMNDTPKNPTNRELRFLFCERFSCSPAQFEKRAFWKCLYPHAKMVALFIRLVKPSFFERDHHFIRCFGNAKNWKEAKSEIVALRYEDRFHPKFLRNTLRLRISRRKANQLASRLFPDRKSLQRASAPLPEGERSPQKAAGVLNGENHAIPERPLFDLRSKEHP
jgi:hypothetical protein